jgi:hypothetical protein
MSLASVQEKKSQKIKTILAEAYFVSKLMLSDEEVEKFRKLSIKATDERWLLGPKILFSRSTTKAKWEEKSFRSPTKQQWRAERKIDSIISLTDIGVGAQNIIFYDVFLYPLPPMQRAGNFCSTLVRIQFKNQPQEQTMELVIARLVDDIKFLGIMKKRGTEGH